MENLIMQGILFSAGDEILPRDVGLKEETRISCLVDNSFQDLPYKEAKEQTLQSFNTNYINNLLAGSNGNVTRAAKICGLERQSLQQVMRRYGIKAASFRDRE
jgi:DNA-binding NtrC family response regulator